LYLAPELLRGSAPTVQSDIYSLGVLLYHLLTGSYPVQAQNLGLLRAAHELREGFGAGMLVDGLPRRLGRVIDRAIRPHPGERYGDVESVAADLTTVSAPWRRLSVVSAAAVAVVLCIAAVWWALGREPGSPAAANPVSSSNVVLPFKPSAARGTTSPEAHRHYLFGRYHMEIRRPDRMLQAEQEFREALKIDPRYADAHAALSLALVHTAWRGARRGIDVMGPAKDVAMQALAIDESVALAYSSLGNIYELFEYDHLRSQAAHLKALALDPSDLWVLRAYASFLMRRDAVDEALAVIQKAIELDPASPLSNRHRAMMLYTARRYDECVALTRRTLALDPEAGNSIAPGVVGVDVILESALLERDLSRYDCIFLCNVAQFTASEAQVLHNVLSRGGGVAIGLPCRSLIEELDELSR
jgi:tetratricopeptide (TPR) repeat protein